MGKNKLKKFAEINHFPHVIQLPYSVLKNEVFELKGKWSTHFFNNGHPIVLELGCGKGEYTVNLARQYPNKNFIGIDIKGARMWSGAKESLDDNLKNVAFVRTNIEMVNSFFDENEVSEIWITFPDPQMQKVTKRLTGTPFIERYKALLVPDGIVHLKTDSDFMYKYTLEMIKENNLNIMTQTDNLYGVENKDSILEIKTYYEQQWIARGFNIKYIQFKLNNTLPLKEPTVVIEQDAYRSFNRENIQKL